MASYVVMQGDVVEQLKMLDDDSIDVIATDPPYNLGMDEWDKWESDQAFREWCYEWGVEAFRVLKPGGTIFAFSAGRTYHWMAIALSEAGFNTRDMIEWVYWGTMPRQKNLKSCHEPIYMGTKGKHKPLNVDACRVPLDKKSRTELEKMIVPNMPEGKHPGRKAYGGDGETKKYGTAIDNKSYQMNESGRHPFNVVTTTITEATFPTNVIDNKKPRGKESIKGHQTQKPVSVMKWMIELASNKGDIVLDLFGGTGTTGQAALEAGRNVVLIERESDYVDIIDNRLTPIVQKTAVDDEEALK